MDLGFPLMTDLLTLSDLVKTPGQLLVSREEIGSLGVDLRFF